MPRKPTGPQKPTVLAAPQSLCRLLEDELLETNTIPQTHQMQIHGAAGIRLTGWGAGGPVCLVSLLGPAPRSPCLSPHRAPPHTSCTDLGFVGQMYQASFWSGAKRTWQRDPDKKPAPAATAAQTCRQSRHNLKQRHLTFRISEFQNLVGGVGGAEGVGRCNQRESSRDMRTSGE